MAKAAERGIRIQYDTDRKIRARNKLSLPREPLAHLDHRVLPGARSADL